MGLISSIKAEIEIQALFFQDLDISELDEL